MKKECIALIPARSGSKRIKNKNIRLLNNLPLIAYTIKSAIKSNVFSKVIVSTESDVIANISKEFGAEIPFLRPEKYSTDLSPDIEWISHLLNELKNKNELSECFSILRPTSPFRQPETIKRAWKKFNSIENVHSLRAIEKCSQHPAKMWFLNKGDFMKPVLENPNKNETPWHSRPYQDLPEIYVQNASLEIAYSKIVLEQKSISGENIIPFITEEYEGFDINNEYDWIVAEELIKQGKVNLPI